jgi:hypothetical protein
MNESVIRDFFQGVIDASTLERAVIDACELVSASHEQFTVSSLDADFLVTRWHAISLASAASAGKLSFTALSHVAFLVIASDHLAWDADDDLLANVLHDWASPEINTPLTPATIQWFRLVLTGEAPYEPGPPVPPTGSHVPS